MNFIRNIKALALIPLLLLASPIIMAQTISNFKKITSQDEIVDGGRYILVCEEHSVAMGSIAKNSAGQPCSITITNNIISSTYDIDSSPYILSLQKLSGYWRIKHQDSYLGLAKANEVNLKTYSVTSEETTEWSITFNNNVEIDNLAGQNTSRRLVYSPINKSFKNYDTGPNTPSVCFYRQYETVTINSNEGYGTFYTDKPYIMPEGLKGAAVTKIEDGILTLEYLYKEGDVVPANTALIIQGPKGEYTCYTTSLKAGPTPTMNYLRGTLTDKETSAESDSYYYKLSYLNGNDIGFYWGEENGGAFQNKGGKAYLAIPKQEAKDLKGFSLDGSITGIKPVPSQANTEKVAYTLQGQRVDIHHLKKGDIYIIDGKKVIIN